MDPLSFVFGLCVGGILITLLFSFGGKANIKIDPLIEVKVDPNPERTYVELRETKGAACRIWQQPVRYDAWGAPYVKKGSYNETKLYKDGRTGDYVLRGTEWKRVSGPPVTWGETPTHPFGEANYDPNAEPKATE